MGQTQTVFLPPWEPTTEAEKERADEFRSVIRGLSGHSANFLSPHSAHDEPDFCFDWIEHRTFAAAAYTGDPRLGQLIPRLVPKQCALTLTLLHHSNSPTALTLLTLTLLTLILLHHSHCLVLPRTEAVRPIASPHHSPHHSPH